MTHQSDASLPMPGSGPASRSGEHGPSRRRVLGAAAWTAPAVIVASATPAYAVSNPITSLQVLDSGGNLLTGTGVIDVLLTPDPNPILPVQVTTYDDEGATTSSFARVAASGGGAIYRLRFSTTTVPVPAIITANINVTGFGSAVVPVSMNAIGTVDPTFQDPGLNSTCWAVALDSSGKAVVAGSFTSAGTTDRGRLARFNTDGTLDTTFADPLLDGTARGVAVAPDGKILVTGDFTSAGGQTRSRLARFNTDGTLDTTFADPNLDDIGYAVAVDATGKVLVTGDFTTAGATPTARAHLARFNTDGTLDTTFADPLLGARGRGVAVDGDGKVVVTGNFTTAGSGATTRGHLARFNSDGSLDSTFADPNLNDNGYAVAIDANGKVLVTGEFTTAGAGNTAQRYLARLNADGTQDSTFANPNSNGFGRAVAVAPDGKVVLAGLFSTAGGQVRGKLARYNANGTLDASFNNPDLDNNAQGVAVAADKKVVVGGTFQNATGQPRKRLARILG